MTRGPTVKRRMVNPSPQFFIVPQGSSYLQAEEAGRRCLMLRPFRFLAGNPHTRGAKPMR